MIAKLTKALMVVALLAAYASVWPTVCNAWSLLHPFSSDEPAAKKPVLVSAQKPPSTWDKVVAGPKNLFNKTGEKLGLKKPEKKPVYQYACPRPPVLQKKQPEQKSWFGSWFKPKEPEKKSVSDWLGSTKQINP